ncbi:MAG: carbonic anhydrase family protein, partial [Cyanobacteria bacterium P01_D01_bin.123]
RGTRTRLPTVSSQNPQQRPHHSGELRAWKHTLTLDGQPYELLQFHFHDPSEHTVEGSAYPMEVHLVYKNEETGGLAVVGFFLDEGAENEVLQTIWDEIPAEAGPEIVVENAEIDVAALLPENTEDYYRYFGSLATPPCSEVVNWIVLKEPVPVSPGQVESFVAAVGENARPVQTVGRRFLLD